MGVKGFGTGIRPRPAPARWIGAFLCLILVATAMLHGHDARAAMHDHVSDTHVVGAGGAADDCVPHGAHFVATHCPSALGCSLSVLAADVAVAILRPRTPSPAGPMPALIGADLLLHSPPPKPSTQV